MPGHLFPKSCRNRVVLSSLQLGNLLIRPPRARLFCLVAQYSDDAFEFRSFTGRVFTQPSGMAGSVMPLVDVPGGLATFRDLFVRAAGQQYAIQKG